jgi:hypothetical protein
MRALFDLFTRLTLPALLSCRSRGPQPLRWEWLRIADRIGLSPKAAALPKGGDKAMATGLLQCEDFQALVEAARELREEPVEAPAAGSW